MFTTRSIPNKASPYRQATPLSRLGRAHPHGVFLKCAGRALVRPWHVACMFFVQSCLYIAPIRRPDVNQHPDITRPIGSDTLLPLRILGTHTVLTVVANDPEDEVLTFVWDVPRANDLLDVNEFQSGAGDWISTLRIPSEWVQEDDLVRCSISDQAKPRNVVAVEWEVVAP